MGLEEQARKFARDRAAEIPEAEYPAFRMILERELVAAALKWHAKGVADAGRRETAAEEEK